MADLLDTSVSASSYPAALDTRTTLLKNKGTGGAVKIQKEHFNNLADAIVKTEGELGVDPAGTVATVAARFTALEASAPAISSGVVAPASTPGKVGDVYVDTSAKKLYFAVGTSASTDWIIAN